MATETLQALIAPSILASDFSQVGAECSRMIEKEGADWLHLDVMDGHFVPAITFGHQLVGAVHKVLPETYLDCHMMVSNPDQWIDAIAEAGGSSYTFHIEALSSSNKESECLQLIRHIHQQKMKAALAISPQTASEELTDSMAKELDMILVMTVHPGKGGQKFMQECIEKVDKLRKRFPNTNIQVDGGVGPSNAGICAHAGANVIVSGTAVFGAENPRDVMEGMRTQIREARASWASKA